MLTFKIRGKVSGYSETSSVTPKGTNKSGRWNILQDT